MCSQDEFREIVDGGYCIGCGACALISDEVRIDMGADGQYRATYCEDTSVRDSGGSEKLLKACPFSSKAPNENKIAENLFSNDCKKDDRIGMHCGLYAGYVEEGSFREQGTSGGVITWLLSELLQSGKVDAVIHVRSVSSKTSNIHFQYAVSRSVEEVIAGAKSRYYPVEISKVMDEVRQLPGRYVFVGLPCFVKAVRRLCLLDDVLQDRIVYCVGLVCGHLKSKAYGDCFAWQAGIPPGELDEIDFRVKIPGRAPYDYGVQLSSSDVETVKPAREFYGSNWGWNLFRYSACDYCDDVFAETADVVVGDAWLPEYMGQSEGNSVVVVRNLELKELIDNAHSAGRLQLDLISASLMAHSQAGGLRDRREGLAYRLYLKKKSGEWAPPKRVVPSCRIPRVRKRIYECRLELRSLSHKAWQESVFEKKYDLFTHRLQPAVARFERCYHPLRDRVFGHLKHLFIKLFGV